MLPPGRRNSSDAHSEVIKAIANGKFTLKPASERAEPSAAAPGGGGFADTLAGQLAAELAIAMKKRRGSIAEEAERRERSERTSLLGGAEEQDGDDEEWR